MPPPTLSLFAQLATGYAPNLLQMYATAEFEFNQADNGWLMSGNAFMRAIFLIFIFPRIIGRGRIWFASRARKSTQGARKSKRKPSVVVEQVIPEETGEYDAPTGTQGGEEPIIPKVDDDEDKASFEFIVTAPSHYKVISNGVLQEPGAWTK